MRSAVNVCLWILERSKSQNKSKLVFIFQSSIPQSEGLAIYNHRFRARAWKTILASCQSEYRWRSLPEVIAQQLVTFSHFSRPRSRSEPNSTSRTDRTRSVRSTVYLCPYDRSRNLICAYKRSQLSRSIAT
jgi:hypothetical protein